MKAVLDTNIYVDFARGRSDVVDLLAIQSTEILLPAVVMGELFYGFMKGSRTRYKEEKFHRFVTWHNECLQKSAFGRANLLNPAGGNE